MDQLPDYQNQALRQKFLADIYRDGVPMRVNHNLTRLTKREYAICQLLLQGQTMRQMAMTLMISPRTVETHLLNLRSKLGASSKPELIARLSETFEKAPVGSI